MRDTPETKAFKTRIRGIDGDKHWVPAGFAEILERERDEARKHLKEIEEYGTDEINAAVDLRRNLAQALVDLDDMQYQRDEAREQIKELIYISERAIDLAEIDFENDKFGIVSELRYELKQIMQEGAK
jgi:hypothetical protein